MFTTSWQRPLVLAAASVALFAGTACAAQASEVQAPAGLSASALADQPPFCGMGGEGGKGGKGGEGGKGGQPGQPGEPGQPGRSGCRLSFGDLPDKPKSDLTVADKVRIVALLMVEDSDAMKKKIAEKYDIPADRLDTWKQNYLDGDWFALMDDPTCE